MRERITWFLAGAVVAGTLVHVTQRPAGNEVALRKLAEAQSELMRQQARLDARLATFEQRATAHPMTSGQEPMPAPASTTVPPSLEQQRAAETGSGIVQRAIAAGIWTRQDADEFSAAGDMDGNARLELRRQLAVAINEDRLKVEPGAEFRW
jgi:hypothetical protein